MEYVYASLLLHSAGKEINEENVRKVLEAAGIEVDEVRLKALVAALKNINIDEAIKTAVPMAAPAAVPAEAPAEKKEKAEEKKEEEKKEEEKKEVSEEEIAAGLEALFG